MSKQTGSKSGAGHTSESDFAVEKPLVHQEERVFNLHGQGKPITDMDDYNFSGSGSQQMTSGGTQNFSGNVNSKAIEPEGTDKGLGY